MPIETQCPSCTRPMRVPDDLLGKKVKCPSCDTVFTAQEGMGVAGAADSPMVREPRQDEGRMDYDDFRERPRGRGRDTADARSLVSAPAICLIVLGVINLLLSAYLVINGVVSIVMFDQIMKDFDKEWDKQMAQQGQQKPPF